MDFSENYIRMCVDAQETLRKAWVVAQGDYIHWIDDDKFDSDLVPVFEYDETGYQVVMVVKDPETILLSDDMTWLPRQSTLQNLVTELWELTTFEFMNWMKTVIPVVNITPLRYFKSLEQCWLAFYMWKCHEKIWYRGTWR